MVRLGFLNVVFEMEVCVLYLLASDSGLQHVLWARNGICVDGECRSSIPDHLVNNMLMVTLGCIV